MSEEQTALNDVLNKKEKEPAEETQETAEETQEPAPAEQSEEQKPEEEQRPAEEKPEEPAEEKKEEPEPEPKEEVEQKEEPAPEKKEEAESSSEQSNEVKQKKEEPKKQEAPKPRKALAENVVLVGKKPTMSYVLAAVTQFSDGLTQIHIKARGRSISRAVDVAEVVKNRFVQDVKKDVQIGTQEITDENNNKINVSTINISLSK